MPNVLITGITGQDGRYLAELLLAKGYKVYGLVRRASTLHDERIRHLLDDIELVEGDLLDQVSLIEALQRSQPHEVYNLASMSHARIKFGLQKKLVLGNLEAQRDWGFAGDYVEAMWRTLQQKVSEDYVIATGVACSVRDFVAKAFECGGIAHWEQYVEVNPLLFRPAEVDHLVGDATKAREKLGWRPRITFEQLVAEQVHLHTVLLMKMDCL